MKTFRDFLNDCLIESHLLFEYYYGDSIAVGYGGRSPGRRRVGASPSDVYGFLERDYSNNPNIFRGQTVNLSSGISNNPNDYDSIERQLKLLRQAGANVSLLGAAQGRFDAQNERLRELAARYGANFRGGFRPGRDGVHPASYNSYDTGATQRPSSSSSSGASPSATSNQNVLSKLRGVEGSGVGSNFVARTWTNPEKARYKAYGGK